MSRGADECIREWTAIVWFLALAALQIPLFAQQKPLSPKAQKLVEAFHELQKSPGDPRTQLKYLQAFPHDYQSFLELFDFRHELYDGHEYVWAIRPLAKNHEQEVGKLLVQLSKDAHYEADAPSYLQHATATFGAEHTRTFVTLLSSLAVEKRDQLISFLADVENHSGYEDYQHIIDNLKAIGENEMALRFEAARTERSKRHH